MDRSEAIIKDMLEEDSTYKIGNDILFLPDFTAMLNNGFIKRVYTESEKIYCDQFATPSLRYASTFSAKEAVYKAVKQMFPSQTLAFNKIEITRDRPAGKPTCTIHYPSLSKLQISLSISHDRDYVWSIALLKNI